MREQAYPVSAQDLFLSLRDAGSSLGLSTVYRALKEAVWVGDARELRGVGREVLYVASSAMFLHLVCSRCGQLSQVRDDRLGDLLQESALRHGFDGEGISVVVRGRCRKCSDQEDELA